MEAGRELSCTTYQQMTLLMGVRRHGQKRRAIEIGVLQRQRPRVGIDI